MKRTLNLLIFATVVCSSILLAPVASSGDIYTWTDENGTQHFGARPPNGVRDFKMLKKGRIEQEDEEQTSSNQSATPATTASAVTTGKEAAPEAPQPAARKGSDQAPSDGESDEATLDDRQASLEEQVKKLNCDRARKRLQKLSEKVRFKSVNEKGETVMLTEEDVEAQRAQAEKMAAESC